MSERPIKFTMADHTPASAALLLRRYAEATADNSRDWDNLQSIFEQFLTDAYNGGRAYLAERVEKLERALERIIGMCDCPDGDTGRCGNCGRPNGIPAIVACAERALTDDGLPREG